MSKFIQNDYIDVSSLSQEDFIHLHQTLEDSGEKMLETTNTRRKYIFDYKYLVYCDKSGWFGSTSLRSRYLPVEKVYSILNITIEPNYEVY
jgi:hypothetical protein